MHICKSIFLAICLEPAAHKIAGSLEPIISKSDGELSRSSIWIEIDNAKLVNFSVRTIDICQENIRSVIFYQH